MVTNLEPIGIMKIFTWSTFNGIQHETKKLGPVRLLRPFFLSVKIAAAEISVTIP